MTGISPKPDTGSMPRKGRAPVWLRWLAGGALGYAMASLAFTVLPIRQFAGAASLTQSLALSVGVMAAAVGLIILIMSFSKRAYEAENWTAESDPDEHQQKVPQLRISALGMIAMAAQFIALSVPLAPGNALPVVAITILSLVVQLWTTVRIWQNSDELHRKVIVDGSAFSLAIIFVLLSLWVPFALYGFASFDPIGVILMATVASFVPTIWISVRRGLTK